MIVEGRRPYRPVACQCPTDIACAESLEQTHKPLQRPLFPEFDQPMGMVRHQHPRKHPDIAQQYGIFETATDLMCGTRVDEERFTSHRRRRDVIDAARCADAALTQGSMSGVRQTEMARHAWKVAFFPGESIGALPASGSDFPLLLKGATTRTTWISRPNGRSYGRLSLIALRWALYSGFFRLSWSSCNSGFHGMSGGGRATASWSFMLGSVT